MNGREDSAVGEERKRKVRPRRKRRRVRVRRVWTAAEWLGKVDWAKFGPHNPKRQAWELIRRLADEAGESKPPAESWAERVRR